MISIVLPAFNEEASIGVLLEKLAALNLEKEIIVVDDCSKDRTSEIALKYGCKVIKNPINIGNGYTVKKGIQNASGEIIVLMDADGQHPVEAIEPMLNELYKNDWDMIVAARPKDADVSKFRTFGNRILNFTATYLTGEKIIDLTSGFRLFKREKALEFLHLFPKKFSYPTTLTISFLKSGYAVKFFPVKEIRKRTTGKSSIKPFSDGIKFIKIIFKMVMIFEPFKIFMPLSLLSFFCGIITSIIQLYYTKSMQESGIILILSGIMLFFFSFIAEQVSTLLLQVGKIVKR